jgi:hypothetical protein
MRNTYSIFGLLLGIVLSFNQVKAIAPTSFPNIGISNKNGFAPRDSSFSIKLHSGHRLQNAQTTLTVNMGGYKGLRYIKMYDLIGKKVFFQSLSYKPGISTFQIKLASLRPGIYVCSVYSDFGLVETRKLIHF